MDTLNEILKRDCDFLAEAEKGDFLGMTPLIRLLWYFPGSGLNISNLQGQTALIIMQHRTILTVWQKKYQNCCWSLAFVQWMP